MDPRQIAKQMIVFYKTVFNNNINAMNALHEQTGRFINKILEKSPMVTEEGKKAFSEWLKTCKSGCENFRNNVDENIKKMEDFFNKSK
jgi:polyhydroxyalkanoate synthesis regulator phasin